MTINLQVPDLKELKPRITVFGVGGAGGNAVNNMIESGLSGVDFVVANTDSQALTSSVVERKIQMGVDLTEGLGAGSHPEVGRSAAEEAQDEIREELAGAHMVFITAGMGGGTGTGAAPVVARIARELGILTVGVVTKPFQFEGQRRMRVADAGIEEMQRYVDTLIVIPNQNLFRVANEKTTFADAFAMADEVLHSGVACITDLIVKEGLINLDFADVRAVMSEMGKAMMGTGEASGDNRATDAAEAAIANPLLDDVSMRGARGLLISITGGDDLTLFEVDEAASRIRDQVDSEANVILGATFDQNLNGCMRVSVVATGIASEHQLAKLRQENEKPASIPDAVRNLMQAARSSDDYYEDDEAEGMTTVDGITIRPLSMENRSEPEHEEEEIAYPAEPYIPPRAEQAPRNTTVRMPRIEEFPLPARRELQASREDTQSHGVEAQKKKSGFLDRLKGMGVMQRDEDEAIHGSREPIAPDPIAPPTKVAIPAVSRQPIDSRDESDDRAEPRAGAQGRANDRAQVRTERIAGRDQQHSDSEDDQLEIPAFLRRQAN